MAKMIFVNLPVTNLAKSTAFYEALGGKKNPRLGIFWTDPAAMGGA